MPLCNHTGLLIVQESKWGDHKGAFTHTRGEANVASPLGWWAKRGDVGITSLKYVWSREYEHATTIQNYKNGAVSCRDEYSLEFTVP